MAVRRGSWYGNYGRFRDSQDNNRPASGYSNRIPSIALPQRSTLSSKARRTQHYYMVKQPNGYKEMVIHGDYGPSIPGRVDVNARAATDAGYRPNTYPTGGKVEYIYLGHNVHTAIAKAQRMGAVIPKDFGGSGGRDTGRKVPVRPAAPQQAAGLGGGGMPVESAGTGIADLLAAQIAQKRQAPVGQVPLPTPLATGRSALKMPLGGQQAQLESGGPGPSPKASIDEVLAQVNGLAGGDISAAPASTTTVTGTKVTPVKTPTGATVPMTEGGARAVAWAAKQVGTMEAGSSNRGKLIDQWQRRFGMAGQPWCGLFVGNAARNAGARGLTSRVASVPNIITDAQAKTNGFKGWFRDSKFARPGDFVVLFGGGHVELVVGRNRDGSVRTVGGNTSAGSGQGVARKTRSRGEITGFARPVYGGR